MLVKTAISEEEYLATSFPDLDREYCDGKLVKRSLPDYQHGATQANISTFFCRLRKERGLPVFGGSSVRNRVRTRWYRIPDVCAFWPDEPAESIPEIRPHVVVEILSQDDTMVEVLAKLREYLDWGVPHIWLINPRHKTFFTYGPLGLRETATLPIPEVDAEMLPSDAFD